jgi:hypothetical protein
MYKKRREVSRLYITFVMLNMMKVIKPRHCEELRQSNLFRTIIHIA